MPLKVLVLGASGQLGTQFRRLAQRSPHDFTFWGRDEISAARGLSVESAVSSVKPNYILNCAAYTAVDKAESEVEQADLLNHLFVRELARSAKKSNAALVHFSTDYVFDGRSSRPYVESDPTGPLSVYGRTKLAGEIAMKEELCAGAIFRTSWLYSTTGTNFVKTILRLGSERSAINIVSDQIGTPTYSGDLAKDVLANLASIGQMRGEVFHYSNQGIASWYDFAKVIVEKANLSTVVSPIESKDYPTAATRPQFSVMSKKRVQSELNIKISHWMDSLVTCLNEMGVHPDFVRQLS